MDPQLIFKICTRGDWDEAVRIGAYHGSADDRRDGFIHFSTREQLPGTAAKHFRGMADLVIVSVPSDRVGSKLRWEPSRGGALFPHLYASLDTAAACAVRDLPLGPEGIPTIPEDLN